MQVLFPFAVCSHLLSPYLYSELGLGAGVFCPSVLQQERLWGVFSVSQGYDADHHTTIAVFGKNTEAVVQP